MPDNISYTDIQGAWMDFTNNVRLLVVPLPDERPMDQYLEFRNAIFKLVQSQQFLNDLQLAWETYPFPPPSPTPYPVSEVRWALFMELKAFSNAVEVAKATEKDASESKGWLSRWLSRASTVTGSVKDVMDNLPPYAKVAITLFKELTDLFKGKD